MKGAMEFLDFIRDNPEYMQELDKLESGERTQKLKDAGFSFTKAELDAALEKKRELNADELDAIAGGCSGHCGCTCENDCMCDQDQRS